MDERAISAIDHAGRYTPRGISDCIESSPALSARTAVILTATTRHGDEPRRRRRCSRTIGCRSTHGSGHPGGDGSVPHESGLSARSGISRPDYLSSPQPVRKAEAANVALDLSAIGAVPGSTLDPGRISSSRARTALRPPGRGDNESAGWGVLHDRRDDTIEVEAAASAGSIVRVVFYADGGPIGEDSQKPVPMRLDRRAERRARITVRAVQTDSPRPARRASDAPSTFRRRARQSRPRVHPRRLSESAAGRAGRFLPSEPDRVEIALFDLSGRRVREDFSAAGSAPAGTPAARVRDLAPGLYVFRMEAGGGVMNGQAHGRPLTDGGMRIEGKGKGEWRTSRCAEGAGFVRAGVGRGARFGRCFARPVTCYVGFDPTASSFHVGSLVPIMAAGAPERHGHRVIALIGGGTALIGDPSGKTEMRRLISAEDIDLNAVGLRAQLGRFLDFSSEAP